MPVPALPFPSGAPCWTDVLVADVDAAARLYSRLFGWEAAERGTEEAGYRHFLVGDAPVGGLGTSPSDGPASSIVYLATEAIAWSVDAVREHGGTVEEGPLQLFDSSSVALCKDPTGARFGLWQGMDTPGFGLRDEPGAPCWFDLHTRDGAAARAFYTAVFGVEFVDVPGPGNYATAWPAGQAPEDPGASGALFGVQDIGDQPVSTPTWWQAWIEVSDVPAAYAVLAEAGAQELMAPAEAPMPFIGMRQIALALAPQGEFVGLLGR